MYKVKADYTINNLYTANLTQLNYYIQRLKKEKDVYTKNCLHGKIKSLRVVIQDMENKFILIPQDNLKIKIKEWL